MKEQSFNPAIEAVTTIRHLAMSISDNWSAMKSVGAEVEENLNTASLMVNTHAESETRIKWKGLTDEYRTELDVLKGIMSMAIDKINQKDASSISANWGEHHFHVERVEEIYDILERLGRKALPENKINEWETLWLHIKSSHSIIRNEANAIGTQLQLIELYNPEEVDELTDTILKHIPMTYSNQEAHQYTDEYIKAYEEIKKEASQKKNLWDRFLDILAGGVQQTPAQRVMMKRWVDGEKGDSH